MNMYDLIECVCPFSLTSQLFTELFKNYANNELDKIITRKVNKNRTWTRSLYKIRFYKNFRCSKLSRPTFSNYLYSSFSVSKPSYHFGEHYFYKERSYIHLSTAGLFSLNLTSRLSPLALRKFPKFIRSPIRESAQCFSIFVIRTKLYIIWNFYKVNECYLPISLKLTR